MTFAGERIKLHSEHVIIGNYHHHTHEGEVGRACGMYDGEEKCIQGFDGETWRKEAAWKTST
jgi:hypothetical protein